MTYSAPDIVSSSTGMKVLLIDHDSGSLSRIHQLLTDSDLLGFRLDCVTTPPAASNKFHGDAHDVCIIDSAANQASEFLELARRLGSNIPAIVITSSAGTEVLNAFRAGAADCLLRESLTPSVLEQSICRVIQEAQTKARRIEIESRYLGLIENAKDILYTHDLAGNYKSSNKAAQLLTGYTAEEILTLNAKDVLAPEFLEMAMSMVDRKLDAQQATSYELELLTKHGRRLPVEVNTHLIYNAGRPVGVQGIARDITQRRAFEAALRESELRYRELFENANDIVYTHDLGGNITSLNKAGELLTGYSASEALKMNMTDVLVPEHLSRVRSSMSQKSAKGVKTVYDLDIITKAGNRISLEVSSRLIYRNGKPVAVQGIARDITERKRSELERRVILEIIESVTNTSNLDDLLRSIHLALGRMLSAENCFVALYDKQTGVFDCPFFVDEKTTTAANPKELGSGVTAFVFRTGEPVLLSPMLFKSLVDLGEVEQIGEFAPSWLGVPLKTPSETIGVLVVQDYNSDRTYNQRDLEFLNSVGGQIALAIERKRAEQALKRSEEEYRGIFDNSMMGIYRSTPEGNLITANRALASILGYNSMAELLNCNLVSDVYFDPNDRQPLINDNVPVSSAEQFEVQWKKKDGTPIWIQLNAIAILDDDGQPLHFDGFVHDISKRKKTEKALRESEERYQRLVELSPDAIFVHTDGRINFINSSGVRMIGASSAESVVGRSIYSFVESGRRSSFVERGNRIQRGEVLPSVELKTKRTDGVVKEFEVMSLPFAIQDRAAVQTVVRDITARKQVAQAMDEANRRALEEYERLVKRITALGQSIGNARDLKTVLSALRDFTTASVPCDGMVVSLFEPEKSLRRPAYCWVDNNEIETDGMSFPVGNGITGRAIRSGEIVIENRYQETLNPKTSTTIGDLSAGHLPQSALSAPMIHMGKTIGCVEIQTYQLEAYTQEHKTAMSMAASLAANAVENVTLMEREAEQADQLRQSQKMEAVGQLAGGIAHDFNNLLTAISGYSDLGLRRLGEGDPLRRNLEEIKKASTRASSLTRQLLAFSRKQMLQAKVIDLNAIVSDMDRMLRRLIGEDIDLITFLEPSSCRIKADPGQIEQVILNLAVNARDAMPRGGKITIETGRVYLDENYARAHVAVKSGHYIMMAVSDTGTGMDTDTQERVFEPFFTTKDVGKGTGLGLSTVYGIVKQSGGSIWVYSEIGKGSTFKVYLPIIHESVELEPKPGSPEALRGRETILLVEDEEMVRNLSREILEMNGYRVLTACDGEQAARLCASIDEEIHLMVTDVVMPQMSGRELSELVVKQRPRMAVLFMSGYTDDAIVRHGVLDDGMPFLQKPFSPDALARKVRELLEQPQAVGV
jgi:PAS domain S-box-containing protein